MQLAGDFFIWEWFLGSKVHQVAHARKSLMPDSCNFVLKSSKLSIDFSAPPLSVHGLKNLLFVGEAWNLIGTARIVTFDLLLKIF